MSKGDINAEDESGKLFVGGLSWETTKESLSQYFSRFGEVVDSVVMKDSITGKARGFGFVTFKDPRNVEEVVKQGPHILDNKTIDPKPCNPRSVQLKKKNDNFKVFLGGLPEGVTESEIQSFFSNYGKVNEVVIMYDQTTKKSRGFGFLYFNSEEEVKKACADHYVHIKGKQIECKVAQKGLGKGGMNQGGMQQQQHQGANAGQYNPMGGQMPNNGMGGMNNGAYQSQWGISGYQPQFNQGPGNGYQNYAYPQQQQQQGGPQGFGNYASGGNPNSNYGFGNYGMQGQGNVPQGMNNQPGPGYNNMNSGGPGMGQNQMGGPGNMGGYPREASNFGPSRAFGGGPMGHVGMQNSGFLPQGPYNNASSGNYDAGNNANAGPGDGPPGGRGGAQQNAGYHPYRR